MMDEESSTDDISKIKRAMKLSRLRHNEFARAQKDAEIDEARKSSDLEVHLEAQLALKKQETQFLTKKIIQYERALEDSRNFSAHKIKAVEKEFNDSYQDYRKSLAQKHNRILSGLSQLLLLVETLERSSLHGRHFVSSETNMGILMKLKLIAKELNQEMNNDNHVEEHLTPMKRQGEPGFDMTLVDICKSLEDENLRLRHSLSATEDELQNLRNRASRSDLIPQYRAAILKYKSDTSILEDSLRRLQVRNEDLIDRLEKSALQRDAVQTEIIRLKDELIQTKQERDQFKTTINRILHHSQKTDDCWRLSKNHQDFPTSGFHHSTFHDHNGDPHTFSEENVQRDLSLLDDEIGDLRRRLEAAAASKTRSLVRHAIGLTS